MRPALVGSYEEDAILSEELLVGLARGADEVERQVRVDGFHRLAQRGLDAARGTALRTDEQRAEGQRLDVGRNEEAGLVDHLAEGRRLQWLPSQYLH